MTIFLNIIQSVLLIGLVIIITIETKNLLRASKAVDMLEGLTDNYFEELEKVQRIAKHFREIEDEVLKKLHSENLNHANEEE